MRAIGVRAPSGRHLLFGWNIGVSNFIFGGRRGYSVGNFSRARKRPPVCCQCLGFAATSSYPVTKALGIKTTLSRALLTAVELAVIVDHERHLPLEDVVVY